MINPPTRQYELVIFTTINEALIRLNLKRLEAKATLGSNKEIAEVKAAKTNIIKNKVPNNVPYGICPNANGKDLKIKPGPAPTFKP